MVKNQIRQIYKTGKETHLSVVTATSAVNPYGIYFCLCEAFPCLIRLYNTKCMHNLRE